MADHDELKVRLQLINATDPARVEFVSTEYLVKLEMTQQVWHELGQPSTLYVKALATDD